MSKYIDGEELNVFQMDVTFKDHHVFESVETLIGSLIGPDDNSNGIQMMDTMVEIVNKTKDIMREHGVQVCAPHYTIEDDKYLPCYNMPTRCSYCNYKNK